MRWYAAVLAVAAALTIGTAAHAATISVKPQMVNWRWSQLMVTCELTTGLDTRRGDYHSPPSAAAS